MILLQVMSQETCYEVSSWQEPWKWRGCREIQRGYCDCQINRWQSNITITCVYNHSCRRPMQYCLTQTKSDSTTCTGRGMEELLSWAPSMLMSLALLAGGQTYYSNYYSSIEWYLKTSPSPRLFGALISKAGIPVPTEITQKVLTAAQVYLMNYFHTDV